MKGTTSLLSLLALLATLAYCHDYCGPHNCYELLGVSPTADQITIRKAFRELAKKHHPDKNRQTDTTELFQMMNKAVEILTDQKSRFKYDLHLQNPTESDYYHEYRYYRHQFIEDPKIHPGIVVGGMLALISLLQYVMRKQMYERAVWSISQGHDFRTKVNERCGKDKKMRERVREEMIQEISIEGGYSKPQFKDILICKLVFLPLSLFKWAKETARWVYKYWIKKEPYSPEDRLILTLKALNLTHSRWQTIPIQEQQQLQSRQLWVKKNLEAYNQEKKQEYLQQLKQDNPHRYAMTMKYLKKHQ